MVEQDRFEVPGVEALTDRIRQLVREGNARRVVVRNDQGEPVVDIPVTAGVVAAVAAPVVTAVAALAALASPWTVNVERRPDAPTDHEPPPTETEPTQTGPSQSGPSQPEPSRSGPGETAPSQTGPIETGPSQSGAEDAPPEPEDTPPTAG